MRVKQAENVSPFLGSESSNCTITFGKAKSIGQSTLKYGLDLAFVCLSYGAMKCIKNSNQMASRCRLNNVTFAIRKLHLESQTFEAPIENPICNYIIFLIMRNSYSYICLMNSSLFYFSY